MWDPTTYLRYADERSRPFFDLTARVGAVSPREVVDLGCGPGGLTVTLASRWPTARVVGIDSSQSMIAKAQSLDSSARFALGDVTEWRPGPETDVVITNAVLQWVPTHRDLLARWAAALGPEAWLAFQVPGNFDSPSHRSIHEIAARPRWRAALRDLADGALRDIGAVDSPSTYAARLLELGWTVDAWETTYLHVLSSIDETHPVLRWIEGTALTPVRTALDDHDWARFRADLTPLLAAAYPVHAGRVLFPFRRVFVVAHRLPPTR